MGALGMKTPPLVAIGVAVFFAASMSRAEIVHYSGTFSAASAFPPTTSALTGSASLTWDTEAHVIVELFASVGSFPPATTFPPDLVRLGSIFGPTELDYILSYAFRPSFDSGDGYYFDGTTLSLLLTDVALLNTAETFTSYAIAVHNLDFGMARLTFVDQATGAELVAAPLAIPEPETYAMLLAGLLLLWVRRSTQERGCSGRSAISDIAV